MFQLLKRKLQGTKWAKRIVAVRDNDEEVLYRGDNDPELHQVLGDGVKAISPRELEYMYPNRFTRVDSCWGKRKSTDFGVNIIVLRR